MPEAWAPTAVGAVDGTTCVTLKIQGARTCTRADGYGCIRCSLYRALGLTGLIRLRTCHAPHVPCTRVFVQCTTLGLVRYTRFTHQLSKFYNYYTRATKAQLVTWYTTDRYSV